MYAHDLALFGGLVALGVVVALRTPVQAAFGFLVITLGKRFARGDRVEIGGVRGEVLHVGLFSTTLREAPPLDAARDAGRPGGRLVAISNSAVFTGPVFRDAAQFDYVWGEISLPLKYDVDLRNAERVCLDAARVATEEVVREAAAQLAKRSNLAFPADDLEPRVYLRLTDNWIEMSIRFLSRPLAVREVKDRISRRLFSAFQEEGIAIATTSMEVVGIAPVRLEGASFDETEPSPHEMQ
ncbi:MAG: mechanosensitive ion channel family protein [Myxococcales bacterium]